MDVLIIGGGIVGASIAYQLSKVSDASIVVCERNTEVVSEASRWSIASFKMLEATTHREMRHDAFRMYNEFLSDPSGDPWYDIVGQLVVATTEEGARRLRQADGRSNGPVLSADVYLEGAEIESKLMVPGLDTETVIGGLYRPYVGYFKPDELAREFVVRAREQDVEFRTDTHVTNILTNGGGVVGVETDSGQLEVDEVVCAAGAWNASMAQSAGVDLPLRHTVASALDVRTGRQPTLVSPKINHRETGSGFRGARGTTDKIYRTGPTGDPGEYYEKGAERDPAAIDADADEIRRDLLANMRSILPFLRESSVVHQDTGLLSRTPDGLPIVGETVVSGFSVAALHAEGIQLAPAIGRTIAAQLGDEQRPQYADAISPARFNDGVEVVSEHGGWG